MVPGLATPCRPNKCTRQAGAPFRSAGAQPAATTRSTRKKASPRGTRRPNLGGAASHTGSMRVMRLSALALVVDSGVIALAIELSGFAPRASL